MSDGSFVHLHVHTEYSMLDGAAKIPPLFTEAARLNMPAVAMTDHGNMFGAYFFHQQAAKAGIKPIIGIEAYVAPASRYLKQQLRWGTPDQRSDDVSNGAYTHLTLLAENATGLRNLFRLSSLASLDGYYFKPRMDRDLLARHAEGIIATTSCPSGEVQTRLRLGHDHEALQAASDFRDIFGPENYFLELMDHGLDIESRVRDGLHGISEKLNLRPLATNDSHYVTRDQAAAHEALLCVQSGKTLHDPNRFKFEGEGYYLKSADEMRALFDEQVPGACDTTLLIAERVQSYDEVFQFVDRMPRFPLPAGETENTWLAKEVQRGLARRYPDGIPPDRQARAEYELQVIGAMGFPAYFLVVADLCQYARRNNVRVGPGRGSAAGSIVAYALEITDLDPIEHFLLFERFLNPDRVSPPDIDLDFDERRRGEMIRYVTQRWGEEKVAQIITFGTIKSKAALKDAARVLGYPYSLGDRLTKAMPPAVMAKDIPLSGIVDATHPRYSEAAEFRALLESDTDAKKVFDTARGLEGLTRQAGVHAAGVILSAEPLLDVLPIWRRDQDGAIITGFDYPSCESMGLLKMDFLGLRNLSILEEAIDNVRANRGIDIDLDTLALDDVAAYQLLARGDTLGVFQLDGGPMRQLLKLMAPTKFGDIAAVLALYRPGPMAANAHIDYADVKNNRKPMRPIHPELEEALEPILGETYHLLIYQEQVMAIAQQLAGYTLGKADLLRRAMGKKKAEILEKEYEAFFAGMRANGYSEEATKTLWEVMLPFSGYAFNKSHTAAYGIISYWTAYLKANYPAEYMAALLTSVRDDKDKMAIYLAEARKMGIKVLPPDINESGHRFTAIGTDIRFGLEAVRNVGGNVVASIIRSRETKGRYTSFSDFLNKSEITACNKRTIESLIKAGAFDELGNTRMSLCAHHEEAIDAVMGVKRQQEIGQFDLFGGELSSGEDAPSIGLDITYSPEEWSRKQLLGYEREMLGLYVSSHPLSGAEQILRKYRDVSIAELIGEDMPSRDERQSVKIAGMISAVQRRVNKNGEPWAIATVEDLEASVEVLVFPRSYEVLAPNLVEDSAVAVQGRINRREGTVSIFASDIVPLDIADADLLSLGQESPVTLVTQTRKITPELVENLKRVLDSHPGKRPVRLQLQGRQNLTLTLGDYNVEVSAAFCGDVKALLGAEGVVG
ncbi:MAG: DNA polymerase III subunit alpha [Pseudonocardiaceae bacterium]